MISVIIPLYNKEKYIERTIKSVLNQTFLKFELIIVDDGSTDCGLDVARGIEDSRIRIIQQTNLGVSIARNRGVSEAIYNYVSFLDADDWWDDHFLEEMESLILKYAEAKIFGSNFALKKKNKLEEKINIPSFHEGYIDYFKIFYNNKISPVCSSAVVIDKSCLKNLSFDHNLKSGEDIDLWMRIACEYKVAYTIKSLSVYNHDVSPHNRATTRNFPKENIFVFHLDKFNKYKEIYPFLEDVTNMLKLRSSMFYYMNGYNIKEIRSLIRETKRTFVYKILYELPPSFVKFIYKIYKIVN